MKAFVTGVGGQLGHDVMDELVKRGYEGIGSDILPSVESSYPYVQLDITDASAVEKAISEVKPGAKVFYCAGQEGAGVYEKYQEGVDEALKDYGDKVEIVGTLHGDWETQKAYDVTTDFISSGTEFDYIFANNGLMAQGCYQALQDAGKTDIPIVSTGGSPDDYKMLQDGIESANMTAPVSIQGVQTFKNLYDYVVLGKTPEKFISLPIIPVGRENIDDYVAWDDYEAAYNYVYNGGSEAATEAGTE